MLEVVKPSDSSLPIKLWISSEEAKADKTWEQLVNAASLPIAKGAICCMPDGHQGYGLPIGGVMATPPEYVVPYAIGVDIGCGVYTWNSGIKVDKKVIEMIPEILHSIRRDVPVGFQHRSKKLIEYEHELEKIFWSYYAFVTEKETKINFADELSDAAFQLGTLGGGNHFIEIQVDSRGFLCVTVHSGSRNLGYRIADYFHNLAVELCVKWHTSLPSKDLAFLPVLTKDSVMSATEGSEYILMMMLALDFAKLNRKVMMEFIKKTIKYYADKDKWFTADVATHCDWCLWGVKEIDVHHNFASIENFKGENYRIHRKGAVRARLNELVVIPGSMGTSTYIAKGLGNINSFYSCSHGAGRAMSRKHALKTITKESVIEEMNKKGVIVDMPSTDSIAEECSSAYKDIEIVMGRQKDLVEVVDVLTPLGVIKGEDKRKGN